MLTEKAITVRKLALGLALLLVLLPGVSGSLGLGNIKVETALNQPLRAEIQLLSIPPGEVDDIKVSLARKEVFDRLGIERPFVLSQLKFKATTKANGETVISVLTNQPVKEPFLNFLVEVEWPKGRLLREYTVLLDPPLLQERRTLAQTQAPYASTQAAAQPTPSPRKSSTGAEPSPGVAAPSAASPTGAMAESSRVSEQNFGADDALYTGAPASSEAEESMGAEATAQTYQTQPGDTLGKIARAYVPDEGVSLKQMMIATLRENPNAFIDGNINNLKAGYVLRIPDGAAIESVNRAEAVAEVSRQYALWRDYRAKIASQTTQSQPAMPTLADAGATDSVSAEVETGGAVGEEAMSDTGANLEILAMEQQQSDQGEMGGAAAESVAEMQKNVALAQELAESRQQQNEELKARVSELEGMLAQQERIINLQTEELAKLQQQLVGSGSTSEGADLEGVDYASQGLPQEELVLEDDLGAEETETSAMPDVLPDEELFSDDEGFTAEVFPEDVIFADGEAFDGEEPFVDDELGADGDSVVGETTNEFSTGAAEDQVADAEFAGDDQAAVAATGDASDSDSVVETDSQSGTEQQAQTEAQDPASSSALGGLDELLASPMTLVALAGTGLLLLALVWLLIAKLRRGKQEAVAGADQLSPAEFENVFQDEAATTAAVSGEQAASAAEMSEDQVLTSAMDPEEAGSADTSQAGATAEAEEGTQDDQASGDDVLSEADVYIAYGLYQQAEDLLKEAIGKTPARADYRFKLLEAYFGTKDKAAFDSLAKELHDSGDSGGELWNRAVAMGKEISPENPLYSGVDTDGIQTTDFAPSKPQATDIDLGAEELELHVPDLEVDSDPNSTLAMDLTVGEEASGDVAQATDEGTVMETVITAAPDALQHSDEPQDGEISDQKSSASDTGIQEVDIDASELERSLEVEESPAEASKAELTSSDDDNLLEFDVEDLDLDLGITSDPPAEEAPAAVHSSTDEEALEFDVADLEIDIDSEGQAAQSTQQLDDSLDIDQAFDETIVEPGDTVVLEALIEDDATEIDLAHLDDTDKEFGKLELGAELAEDVTSPDTESGDVPGSQATQVQDLSEQVLDTEQFDLGDADTELLGDDFDFDDMDAATAIAGDEALSDAGNEIDTKLDLAKAFMDMGDSDGARSTLEEVVQDGDNDQRQAAENLLKQIA